MAKNPIFALLWLILLVFIAWPIAGICAGIWILLQVRLYLTKNEAKKIHVVCVIAMALLYIGFTPTVYSHIV